MEEILCCPRCKEEVQINNEIICKTCKQTYSIQHNIPMLYFDFRNDIASRIKAFYEKNPFPNYEGIDNPAVLFQKSEKGFTKLLNEQLPFNIKILEVGCGTGQLTNFLGLSQRFAIGTDMCFNSLKLGQQFKEKHKLDRVKFYQMNLFKPIFKEESFHLVICSGVLHHTQNPFLGFSVISRLVKRGGYIIIGLYNKYGRLPTDILRIIFNISGERFKFLDYRLRENISANKKEIWFKDQYKNPHESKHTIQEVLRWFKKNNIEFVNVFPNTNRNVYENMLKPQTSKSRLNLQFIQLRMMFQEGKEGGLFIMIGRKK